MLNYDDDANTAYLQKFVISGLQNLYIYIEKFFKIIFGANDFFFNQQLAFTIF